jgi:hypothetical protein
MYWNSGDPEKNLDYVRKHGAINETITGVLPCCNIATIAANGTFIVRKDIASVVKGYKRYGLTVDPVASVPNLSTPEQLEVAKKGITAMVKWAQTINADGILIDYEPSANYTVEHAQNYASFLADLDGKLRTVGKRATCDLASWGILDKYDVFCGKLSSVTTMSAWYQGNDLTLLEEETMQIVNAGCAASTVHVGISDQCKAPKYPNSTCDWTPVKLNSWVDFLLERGLAGMDTWTPDSPQNTPDWYFASFQRFLRGSTASGSSAANATTTTMAEAGEVGTSEHSTDHLESEDEGRILRSAKRAKRAKLPADDDPNFLWPAPQHVTTGGSSAVGVAISPDQFSFHSTSSKAIPLLDAAFVRTRARIFPHRARVMPQGQQQLLRLDVHISMPDEPLRLGVDESYNFSLTPASSKPHTKPHTDTTVANTTNTIATATIEAVTVYGALHALGTFAQLVEFDFDEERYLIRGGPWEIVDRPRFQWRELMVDVVRHFEPIPVLKRLVDSMVTAKVCDCHNHALHACSCTHALHSCTPLMHPCTPLMHPRTPLMHPRCLPCSHYHTPSRSPPIYVTSSMCSTST